MTKWHKYPEEMPEKDGRYIVLHKTFDGKRIWLEATWIGIKTMFVERHADGKTTFVERYADGKTITAIYPTHWAEVDFKEIEIKNNAEIVSEALALFATTLIDARTALEDTLEPIDVVPLLQRYDLPYPLQNSDGIFFPVTRSVTLRAINASKILKKQPTEE